MKKIVFKCLQCGRCCRNLIREENGVTSGLTFFSEDEKELFPQELVSPATGFGWGHIGPKVIVRYQNTECDYCSNIVKRTYPKGLDTEVFSFRTLKRAWEEATDPEDKEHVTKYMLRNPDGFRLESVENEKDYSHLRWCVDTAEDLELVREIYQCLV